MAAINYNPQQITEIKKINEQSIIIKTNLEHLQAIAFVAMKTWLAIQPELQDANGKPLCKISKAESAGGIKITSLNGDQNANMLLVALQAISQRPVNIPLHGNYRAPQQIHPLHLNPEPS